MSLLQKIVEALILRKGAVVAGISVSVKKSEAHDLSADVTDFALESGALVSDHMILKPAQVVVDVGMKNAGPFAVEAARDVYAAFQEIRDKRETVTLVTEHAVYRDMVLKSMTPLHQAPFKGAFTCSLTFRQIGFVQLQSAGRSPAVLKGKAKKTGSAPVNAGRVEAKKVERSDWYKIIYG